MALVCALIFVGSAAANHVACGDVITQDTTLDSNLTCPDRGPTIAASNITLDLAGHAITGPGSGPGLELISADGVTIRNGTIRNFAEGVYTDGGRGTALIGMRFNANGAGVRCQYAPECTIEDSIFAGNGTGVDIASADGGDPAPTLIRRNVIRDNDFGIRFTGEAGLVIDNRVVRNRLDGIANDYGRPVRIAGNVVTANGGDGVRVFYGAAATVAGNHVARNADNGVRVEGAGPGIASTSAIVEDNRITRNGRDGILVENENLRATVQRNDVRRNGDDGIDSDHGFDPNPSFFDVLVRANNAFRNTDLGIEAAPGTTDGGGNRARKNGNPAQCVGVTCSR